MRFFWILLLLLISFPSFSMDPPPREEHKERSYFGRVASAVIAKKGEKKLKKSSPTTDKSNGCEDLDLIGDDICYITNFKIAEDNQNKNQRKIFDRKTIKNFRKAIDNQDITLVQSALAQDEGLIEIPFKDSYPMAVAIASGNMEILSTLLSYNPRLDRLNIIITAGNWGERWTHRSFLGIAFEGNQYSIAKLLMSKGALLFEHENKKFGPIFLQTLKELQKID